MRNDFFESTEDFYEATVHKPDVAELIKVIAAKNNGTISGEFRDIIIKLAEKGAIDNNLFDEVMNDIKVDENRKNEFKAPLTNEAEAILTLRAKYKLDTTAGNLLYKCYEKDVLKITYHLFESREAYGMRDVDFDEIVMAVNDAFFNAILDTRMVCNGFFINIHCVIENNSLRTEILKIRKFYKNDNRTIPLEALREEKNGNKDHEGGFNHNFKSKCCYNRVKNVSSSIILDEFVKKEQNITDKVLIKKAIANIMKGASSRTMLYIETFVKSYYNNLSDVEIAEEYGISSRTVTERKKKAGELIREMIVRIDGERAEELSRGRVKKSYMRY